MNKFEIKNKGETAEIFMYDEVGPSWMGMVGAGGIADELRHMESVKNITVRINSPGGDVFEGLAIYNLLKNHEAKVKVVIDGMAASIASIIAMAGDEIEIAENALVMIHNPWAITAGDADELRKLAETMDQVKDSLLKVYADRTGGDTDDISAMMNEETWLSSEEAVEKGFATSVSQNKVKNITQFNCSKYGFRNIPKEVADEQVSNVVHEPDPDWQAQCRERQLKLAENI